MLFCARVGLLLVVALLLALERALRGLVESLLVVISATAISYAPVKGIIVGILGVLGRFFAFIA